MNKEAIQNYEVKPGFNLGVKFRHNFGIHSFVWGLEYAQMVFIFRYPPDPPFSDPAFYHPEYLSLFADQYRIPLLYQINVGKKKSQFFANTGPSILFGAARYHDRREMTFGDDENTPLYPGELVKEINLAIMMGFGYSYQPISWFRLFSDTRFTVPIFSSYENIRTLGLSWSLGVSFRTSKQ